MSNLIEFLERLGQDSDLRRATGGELQVAMERAGIEPATSAALIGSDRQRLEMQTGAVTNVCCLIHAAEEGDEGDASEHAVKKAA